MDIPFESFAKIVYRLGNPPKRQAQDSSRAKPALSPSKIFQSWLNHLSKPFPAHTGKHLFRLLFPHEGSRRRYGLKEAKLAQELEKILGVRGLTRWDSVCWDAGGEGGTGCLGKEVELIMRDRRVTSAQPPSGCKAALSIREVDRLLDELASSSPFSQLSQLACPLRSTSEILTDLYRKSNLSSYALAVLTQIILRDLRPLLNPLPALPIRNPTAMLRMRSTAGPDQLALRDAMLCWDKRMWELYAGGRGDLDGCANLVEDLSENGHDFKRPIEAGPVVGVNVKVRYDPGLLACMRDCQLSHISGTDDPKITVFSKSMRNSTQDRLNAHSIILSALGLPVGTCLPIHSALKERIGTPHTRRQRGVQSIILEAEVVSYNESNREGGRGPGIEEFWWLGHAGVTANPTIRNLAMPRNRSRHLCLVFFDVLYIDGLSLLHHAYEARRAILEEVIRPLPGFAMLAERMSIPLDINRRAALKILQEVFDRSISNREEGLVLKASDSTYTNMRWQWVKLKKDYIPNLGDCIDLVLLGAGWDVDRARELRVDTSVFTTFYIGVLTNGENVKVKREVPNFEALFRVSYGLDRSALEVYNENIHHGRWSTKSYDKDDPFKRHATGDEPTIGVVSITLMCGSDGRRVSKTARLRGPGLMTAYKSLGYNDTHTPVPSPSKSPPDDSIRALWRSSSTIALIDIPELVSPISSSSSQRTSNRINDHNSPMKRVRSAPELEYAGNDVKDEPVSPPMQDRGSVVEYEPISFGENDRRICRTKRGPNISRAQNQKRRRVMPSFGDAGRRLKEIMSDQPAAGEHRIGGKGHGGGVASFLGVPDVQDEARSDARSAGNNHDAPIKRGDGSAVSRYGAPVRPQYILQPAFIPCTPGVQTPIPAPASTRKTTSALAVTNLADGSDQATSLSSDALTKTDHPPHQSMIDMETGNPSRPRRRTIRAPPPNPSGQEGRSDSSPCKRLISSIDWAGPASNCNPTPDPLTGANISATMPTDPSRLKSTTRSAVVPRSMTPSSLRLSTPLRAKAQAMGGIGNHTSGKARTTTTTRRRDESLNIGYSATATRSVRKEERDTTYRTEKNRPLSLKSRIKILERCASANAIANAVTTVNVRASSQTAAVRA
ncbi:hypothetical protein I317_00143 [Kwoniella heveanensis CBS 569]|nr:hypothetical protein I317_00143 [Kwoniella heveanensis CBS 569]